MTLTKNYVKNNSKTFKKFLPKITFYKDSDLVRYSKVVKTSSFDIDILKTEQKNT